MTQCNFSFSFPDTLVMSVQSHSENGMKHISINLVPAKPATPPAENKPAESENGS